MDRFKGPIAAALAGLDDSEGLLSLRFALAVRKHTQHRFLRRIRKALARRLRGGLKQEAAPESSGIRTRCWHPLDRIARLPPNLPSHRLATQPDNVEAI